MPALWIPGLPQGQTVEPRVTLTSTWLIWGRMIIGAYPDPETEYLETLVGSGVNTFVSFQTEEELKGPPSFADYQPKALELNSQSKFIRYPIEDRKAADDVSMLRWLHELVTMMVDGKVIYMHCHGGVGRTGNMAVLILFMWIKMTLIDSVKLVNTLYRSRGHVRPQFKIPQTTPQAAQLQRMCIREDEAAPVQAVVATPTAPVINTPAPPVVAIPNAVPAYPSQQEVLSILLNIGKGKRVLIQKSALLFIQELFATEKIKHLNLGTQAEFSMARPHLSVYVDREFPASIAAGIKREMAKIPATDVGRTGPPYNRRRIQIYLLEKLLLGAMEEAKVALRYQKRRDASGKEVSPEEDPDRTSIGIGDIFGYFSEDRDLAGAFGVDVELLSLLTILDDESYHIMKLNIGTETQDRGRIFNNEEFSAMLTGPFNGYTVEDRSQFMRRIWTVVTKTTLRYANGPLDVHLKVIQDLPVTATPGVAFAGASTQIQLKMLGLISRLIVKRVAKPGPITFGDLYKVLKESPHFPRE